jgi:hypothetical protein
MRQNSDPCRAAMRAMSLVTEEHGVFARGWPIIKAAGIKVD